MGAQGTATLDFGAFPGASDASVTVTGQSGILAGSLVEAWIVPVATAEHTADEHLLETLHVVAGNIVAGTGFTIYGVNRSQLGEWPQGADINPPRGGQMGMGTRIWGRWSVAWVWN